MSIRIPSRSIPVGDGLINSSVSISLDNTTEGTIHSINEHGICASCGKQEHLVSKYIGFKIDRKLCKPCFVKGMDKLFGVNLKAERVILE